MGICPMGIPYKCLKNIVKTPENEKKLSNVKIKTLIFSSKDFVCGKITGFPHIRISPATPPPIMVNNLQKKMFKNLQIYIEKMAISTHLQDPHTPSYLFSFTPFFCSFEEVPLESPWILMSITVTPFHCPILLLFFSLTEYMQYPLQCWERLQHLELLQHVL